MKSVYERSNLIITEFDADDVITTSAPVAPDPTDPPYTTAEIENAYGAYNSYEKTPGSWF